MGSHFILPYLLILNTIYLYCVKLISLLNKQCHLSSSELYIDVKKTCKRVLAFHYIEYIVSHSTIFFVTIKPLLWQNTTSSRTVAYFSRSMLLHHVLSVAISRDFWEAVPMATIVNIFRPLLPVSFFLLPSVYSAAAPSLRK